MARHGTAAVLAAFALVLPLAACSSSSGDDDSKCLDSPELGAQIAEGASGSPITPVTTKAVKSENSDVYYVAMKFTVDGDTETGVWAVSSPTPGAGSTISVSSMAKAVTNWPDGAAQGITYPNDGTKAAEQCL